jgi:hypothetical protein
MALVKRVAHEWMNDLHSDINQKTGYLYTSPRGIYGKKIKELVNYFSNQSVELKAIRHSRRMKPNIILEYLFYIFNFLSEYVFPMAFAVLASYVYYFSAPKTNITVAPPVFSTPPPETSSWYDWIPSSAEAGQWLGTNIRTVFSIPVSFVANAVDRGIHVQEIVETIQSSGSKLVLTPILFVLVYVLTKIVCRIIIHLRTLCVAQRRVWDIQEIIIQETDEALERGVTSIVRPVLIKQYEELMCLPPSLQGQTSTKLVKANTTTAMIQSYEGNFPLLRMNIFETLTTNIKRMSFAEVLKRGGLSQTYNQAIHSLIRHADDELSNTMFQFHEEINKVPDAIQSRVMEFGKTTLEGVGKVANTMALTGMYLPA